VFKGYNGLDVSRLDLMMGGEDLETQAAAVSGLAMRAGNTLQIVNGARILPIMSTMRKNDDRFKLQSKAAIFLNLSDYNACRASANLLSEPAGIVALQDLISE
jgi:hypothetical protein